MAALDPVGCFWRSGIMCRRGPIILRGWAGRAAAMTVGSATVAAPTGDRLMAL
jgi:hypothetical protein